MKENWALLLENNIRKQGYEECKIANMGPTHINTYYMP